MSTTAEWYLAHGGQQEGPFTEADVVARIRAGKADGQTFVYGPGFSEWTALSGVPRLAAHLVATDSHTIMAKAAPRDEGSQTIMAMPAADDGSQTVMAMPVVREAAAAAIRSAASQAARGQGKDPSKDQAKDQVPSHSLQQFLQETGERDRPGDVFELESKAMLEAHVDGRTWAKLGSMVAYRGQLKFVREGALEGGLGKFMTKMVSGESAPLVKVEGRGVVYLADQKKNITIIRLTPSDALCVNGNDLLAFEESVRHEITMMKKMAGVLAGGLFSVRLTGPGMVAIVTHGDPLTLRCSAQDPVTTDPNATVAWSANLSPEFKTDISFRSLLGRGGGEAFQMHFAGPGFVVVQPYEETPAAAQGSS